MRVLITGAGGMLGRDVVRAAAAAGHEPVGLTRAQLDVADAGAVAAAMAEHGPEVVVNCAAWTDVDGAESAEAAATRVNGEGAGIVAAAAAARGAWTIHVSTDFVFDGRKREPYLESDATGPLSAYGRSKRQGEMAVAAGAPGAHTIVRTAWLFGASGRCFPRTILRLASEREEISVVADQVGCPTYAGHLASALIELAEARVPGVLHVAGAGRCSWFEFARAIVADAGSGCEVRAIDTGQYPTPARRPAFSVLGSERDAPVLPGWREGLARFEAELAEVAA